MKQKKLSPKNKLAKLPCPTKVGKKKKTKLPLATKQTETHADCKKQDPTTESLEQAYVVCPVEKRFLVLYTFIKKNCQRKVIIFFSSCMTVKFYHYLMSYMGTPVMFIHEKQKENKRIKIFKEFSEAESSILLCTDVATRGLDIPVADWMVQYDPPDDLKEYLYRLGRKSHDNGNKRTLLVVTEEELGFIRYLKSQNVTVDPLDITWSKVANIQAKLERLICNQYAIYLAAKQAFTAYVKSYHAHPEKEIFDISKLNLTKAAKCFGFTVPPFVNLELYSTNIQDKRKIEDNEGLNKRRKLETNKRFRLINKK